MGNEASQVQNEEGGVQQRGGKLIGPAVSPLPSDRDEQGSENGKVIGPPLSPLVSDGDDPQPTAASNPPKSTRKKKRRRKSLDFDAGDELAAADTAAIASGTRVAVPESPKKSKKKKAPSSSDETGATGSIASVQSQAYSGHVEDTPQSKKKSKKRSKMAAITEHDVPDQNGVPEPELPQENVSLDEAALPNGDYHPEPEVPRSPQTTTKQKSKQKKPNGVPSPDAQHLLVSHAVGGSPPSGQQPAVNGIIRHEPALQAEATEQDVIPASEIESFASQIEANHLKTEPDTSFDDIEDEELPFRIADDNIIDSARGLSDEATHDRDYLRQKSPFMHKREMSIFDDRVDLESDDEAPIPDLQPSQVKREPPSSESESDLGSPSVARLDRLERSRSRSISRAPAGMKSANENFDAGERAVSPSLASTSAPSRSSTGSNESIPARTQEVRPISRVSAHSPSRHDTQLNGDAMDLDEQDPGDVYISPQKKQAKKQPKPAGRPTNHQQVERAEEGPNGAGEICAGSASSRKSSTQEVRRQQSDDAMSNLGVHAISNWLSQPGRRRPHADVVEESDHDGAAETAVPQETVVPNTTQNENEEEPSQREPSGQASGPGTGAPVNNKSEVPAGQPKKAKKKRRLQSKKSLSLSQLEEDSGEGESQSRVSLSQKSKLKDVMRGDAKHREEGEPRTDADPPQEPAVPKPSKKPKRKRRSNNVSEDEMENLLAGPSRRKKAKRASKTPGLGDGEGTPATTRKALSHGEIATGAWKPEELNALGRVVDQFCKSYDMTQAELNAMIHTRPDMNNYLHKDFWDKAVAAVHQRSRKQIVERTRRLYNNFAGRGHWDDEQKEELHDLFKKHGNKFSVIAQLINRDQKDIRDYWRNQYVVFAHQKKSRWKSDETETLKEAVEEALYKIRLDRENNDQFRPRPRTHGFDDESLLDWQQISTAMGLTRSRQQCKWKWQDLKDKSVRGDDSDHLPKASRESKTINGLSEELANAREDYRGMSVDDQVQVVEAIHDSGVTNDSRIRWNSLVDERFRAKWRRPTLKLVWFRLRKTVPDHEEQDVQSNARYLLNYYNNHQSLPRIEDHQADEQLEEKLVNPTPGGKVWRTPSQEPRAVRERQRRSSSASSRASSHARQMVSSQILHVAGSDDEEQHREPSQRGRDPTPRSGSVDLGQEEAEGGREEQQQQQPPPTKGKHKASRKKNGEDAVSIRIPKHLKDEAAEKALAEGQAKQKDAGDSGGKGKGKAKGQGKAMATAKGRKGAKSPAPPAGGWRSASVALDSDSE
ncbi:hypothetical protein diail_1424 [Diaporthe ilicicola]|nr:hypothetical protein diail_1424 [Diaporthe ilicicola]